MKHRESRDCVRFRRAEEKKPNTIVTCSPREKKKPNTIVACSPHEKKKPNTIVTCSPHEKKKPNSCLFGLVLVWQSCELGHELVVIVLREAAMKCSKLLLISVNRTCTLQEVVNVGRQLIRCRRGVWKRPGKLPAVSVLERGRLRLGHHSTRTSSWGCFCFFCFWAVRWRINNSTRTSSWGCFCFFCFWAVRWRINTLLEPGGARRVAC
jgi:hypothetical protein